MRTIALGPWVGEFGWMVATWAPAMRAYAKKYPENRYVAVVPPGTQELVADFCDIAYVNVPAGKADRWLMDGKLASHVGIDEAIDAWVIPSRPICEDWRRDPRDFYAAFGSPARKPIVAIHARSVTRYGSKCRNWPVIKYMAVLERLGHPEAVSIGSPTGANHIPGTKDCRSTNVRDMIAVLTTCKVCIGPSSGPMHMASHCRCPHVVWTDNRKQKSLGGLTNRDRYKTLWNPFGTPVSVIDSFGWQPAVSTVAQKVEAFL